MMGLPGPPLTHSAHRVGLLQDFDGFRTFRKKSTFPEIPETRALSISPAAKNAVMARLKNVRSILWLVLARGGYSIRPTLSGLLLGLASASPPAVAMHIACKYDPLHMLLFHFVPACGLSVLCSIVFWVLRRKTY